MKRIACYAAAALLLAPLALSAQNVRTFKGNISDSACGLKHMMAGDTPKQCTLECVGMGSKFVLADPIHQKIYALSDQAKAKPFAGEAVVVTGVLKGAGIQVRSIVAAP